MQADNLYIQNDPSREKVALKRIAYGGIPNLNLPREMLEFRGFSRKSLFIASDGLVIHFV